jgi:hypothetical protein
MKPSLKYFLLALVTSSPLVHAAQCFQPQLSAPPIVYDTPANLINPGLQEIKTKGGSATYYINTQGDATRLNYKCYVYSVTPAGSTVTLRSNTNEFLTSVWDGRVFDVKQGSSVSNILGCDFAHQQPAYLSFTLLSKNSSVIIICDNNF